MAKELNFTPEVRLHTWWTNRSKQRYYVIVGLWYGQEEKIDVLEYSHFVPVAYTKTEFNRLIEQGEIKPLNP